MRNTLICTVGTSLKGNLERAKDSPFLDLLKQGNIEGLVLEFSKLAPDDRLLGAEINSITSILQKKKLDRQERLFFLVSDTPDGDLIGQILKKYYGRTQNPFYFPLVEYRSITGLTDSDVNRFRTEGLRSLVKQIAALVTRYGSNTILINATGGYKAQISFAGMIGQALEIPVCYLFERFSEVIELPPQPISLDFSFWLEHVDLFYELAEDQIRDLPPEIDQRFSTLIDQVEVDGQKLTGLSAVGQLFHESFRYRFHQQRQMILPMPSEIPTEQKAIVYEDNNPGKHPGLSDWLNSICKFPYVIRIYTHYYHPSLPLKNYFKPSSKGDWSQIEGGYGNGKATTRFDVVTTAKTKAQQEAVIADLNEAMLLK